MNGLTFWKIFAQNKTKLSFHFILLLVKCVILLPTIQLQNRRLLSADILSPVERNFLVG